MQPNTTINICIAKRCFYTTSLNNGMFRPLYRPSSGCTFPYFKANHTIYSVFVIEISCTSIKFAFKITTVAVELKSCSDIKDINSTKSWACDLRGGGAGYGVKLGIFLFGNTGFLWCHSELVAR